MADTIRQKIVTALTTQLQLILIANGYETDAGLSVYDWRQFPTDQSETVIIIKDRMSETEKTGEYIFDRRLEIEIGIHTAGSTAVINARKIAGDIEKAIGTDLSLGKTAYNVEYVGDTIEVNHIEDIFVDVAIVINAFYKSESWNPLKIVNS